MIYVIGPGHGGPGLVAAAWLEGTYSEVYPNIGQDAERDAAAVHAVLLPRRHPQPRRPGDARVDPRGRRARLLAVPRLRRGLRQPRPRRGGVVGDGEAETGPLATSWHSHKFLDPRRDGAVLPILHLNGYKIANPTVLARIPEDELLALLRGYGHTPYVVAGDGPRRRCTRRSPPPSTAASTRSATSSTRRAPPGGGPAARPWPMIVLRTPKGWTGPKEVDGQRGRGHLAVAPGAVRRRPRQRRATARCSRSWMRSYRPEELFDDDRRPGAGDRRPAPGRRRGG